LSNAAFAGSEFLNSYSAGLTFWGENVLLQSSDGRSENVDVKYSGVSLGYKLAYKAESTSYWSDFNLLYLQGNATSEAKSITFSDGVDGSAGGSAVAGISYYPNSKVSLSAGVGALYYKLQLTPPTSVVSVYDFRYSNPVKVIFTFGLSWDLSSSVVLSQNIISFMDPEVDSLWNVSISYRH
jgi:hypothetical protein